MFLYSVYLITFISNKLIGEEDNLKYELGLDETINNFKVDKKDMILIVNYLFKNNINYLDKSDLKLKNLKKIINDEEVLNVIDKIVKKRKYKAIRKKEDMIYFETWNVVISEMGLVYSKNNKEPKFDFVALTTPIEDGWYYYEAQIPESFIE